MLLHAAHRPHIKLFILIGMTTGARRGAILDLAWTRVKLDEGVIDFHYPNKFITKKRRSVVPIRQKLITALREAKSMATTTSVIEWNGKPVKSIKTAFQKLQTVRAAVVQPSRFKTHCYYVAGKESIVHRGDRRV